MNTLTANYEQSRRNRESLPLPIQMKLSEKLKIFCSTFIAFLKSTFKKKSLLALVFLKLLTPKNVLT